MGLYKEFAIRTQENQRPDDINEEDWTIDHPLRHWKSKNFIGNFNIVTLEALI